MCPIYIRQRRYFILQHRSRDSLGDTNYFTRLCLTHLIKERYRYMREDAVVFV